MLTCYLDSQDYSTLTDPKLDNFERRQLKDALLHLAKSNQVQFAFSAAAVCESIATTPDASHLAELKAELLSELCASNALVSFDRLVLAEAEALTQKSGAPKSMFDARGRWFPEIPLDEKPVSVWEKMRETAEADMKEMGLSRQERRASARRIIKNGKPRSAFVAHLEQQDPSVVTQEIMAKYPMRPEYADVMTRYAFGRATEREFHDALSNSLTDPRWMMKWFTTQHAISSPIADIVRKPGRELGNAMRALVGASEQMINLLLESEPDVDPIAKSGQMTLRWREMEQGQLISLTRRLANLSGIDLGDCEVADIETCCPGLTSGVRSLYSSVWTNVGGGRKEAPSDSQPVDAMHAFYAPYVDVFRADRFMAPHIQKQVKNHGTVVVSRLSQLLESLDKGLK